MLIFYVPLTTEIRIIRVLHTAQDWWSLLDTE
jgi:plasmid stabilization system protein ParE